MHGPGDVRPSGYWSRLRQVPDRLYTEIDKEAVRVSGDLLTRLAQLKLDSDLLQVQVTVQQQRANELDSATDDHKRFQVLNRLDGLRNNLLEVLRRYTAYRTTAEHLEQQAQVHKQAAYAYAKERFAVYLGKLVNHHRQGAFIQSAVNDNYATLGPLPPTESVFAAYTASKDQGPRPVRPNEGE